VTCGTTFPDGATCEPGSVVFLSAEDDPADTIRPRLDAAGADVSRVHVLEAVRVLLSDGSPTDKLFNLETDCAHLEAELHERPDVQLIVIDPLSAYLGGTDSHSNAEIRGLLSPLESMAARCGVAGLDWNGSFEIERYDGTRNFIRTLLRPLPRNGGRVRLLICPYCNIPRLGLYGWEPGGRFTTSAARSTWGCRKCNRLREGGALVHRGRGAIARLLESCGGALRSARTDPWHPHVFTSPKDAAQAGICFLKNSSV
jgi:hypothetical protein